jgi:glycosyl transferase, family 25
MTNAKTISPLFQLLNQTFDKIFVVTLARLKERHQHIEKQLEGLRYDFFFGVDKRDFTESFISEEFDDRMATKLQRQNKKMNKGEIACALSHRKLYEEMLRKGWKTVLVLEDDVVALNQNADCLAAALGQLPADWELLYLGYLRHETVTPQMRAKQYFYKIGSSLGLMKWTPVMIDNLLPKPYTGHLKKAGFHNCTHAYAITQTAAKKLICNQKPVVYRADDLLNTTVMKGELNAFVTVPKFFDQVSFYCDSIVSEIKEPE